MVLCLSLYIPIVLICLVLSILPSLRSLPNVWTFICGYLIFEVLGVMRLTWVWIRYRNCDDWIYQNRLVQIWWACGLLDLGAKVFRLEFKVTGEEALNGPSAILFVRHASMGDTVLPVYFFSRPRNFEGIRYLIKQELQISPSLDIGAHRLSTLFIDRSGLNTEGELDRVGEITRTAPEDESLMIYPEGTRVTIKRRAQIRANHPHLSDQLDRWPDLLPPRLGGPTALLANNPGKDVLFIAHTGFEGLANLKELLSVASRKTLVHVHMWRIPYDQIPEDFTEFMFSQWDIMQDVVASQKGTP